MSERKKLIKELQMNPTVHDMGEGMIDFILTDRKRIVQPLVEWMEELHSEKDLSKTGIEVIKETLKLAGVEKG